MHSKSHKPDLLSCNDRLAEIGKILGLGICRLKQRQEKQGKNGLCEPEPAVEHPNSREESNQFRRQEIKK